MGLLFPVVSIKANHCENGLGAGYMKDLVLSRAGGAPDPVAYRTRSRARKNENGIQPQCIKALHGYDYEGGMVWPR